MDKEKNFWTSSFLSLQLITKISPKKKKRRLLAILHNWRMLILKSNIDRL